MKQTAPFKVLIVALMLAIGVASLVSAVQSRAMAYDMAMSGQADGMGAGGCVACNGDNNAAPAMDCSAVCHSTVASHDVPVIGIEQRLGHRYPIKPTWPTLGLTPNVDPSPPKSILV